MSLFSQRAGIRPAKKQIQRESIDEDLKNGLWTALQTNVWDLWERDDDYRQSFEGRKVSDIMLALWIHFFKKPSDEFLGFYPRNGGHGGHYFVRNYFFTGHWWQILDLLEFVIKHIPKGSWRDQLSKHTNYFLERENSAYRFVGTEIVEITNPIEIGAIESGIVDAVSTARTHLERALSLLSARKDADYRNSIKESISAVEAVCQYVVGGKATLGDSIKLLKAKGHVHPALEQALLKLYGYTSDGGGIRHALSEDSIPPTYSDAKFMLVACSAFVSFVLGKASELNIIPPPAP